MLNVDALEPTLDTLPIMTNTCTGVYNYKLVIVEATKGLTYLCGLVLSRPVFIFPVCPTFCLPGFDSLGVSRVNICYNVDPWGNAYIN